MIEVAEGRMPVYIKGVDIPQKDAIIIWNFLIERGHHHFDNSSFVTGKSTTKEDIRKLKAYYQEVFTFQEEKFGKDGAVFNESLREHLLLSERVAQEIAPLLGIDPILLQAVMLTHDFGRMFSHRRGRNNAIEAALTKKLGFSESFTKLLPTDTLWTDIDERSVQERIIKMTTENKGIVAAVELSDVLAKYRDRDTKTLRRWEDVIPKSTQAQKAPDPKTMWSSELARQKKIASSEGQNASATKYTKLKAWFEAKSGVKINDFIERVERSLKKTPLAESWIN